MPLYMTQFSYTPKAWEAFVKNPEDRSVVFGEMVEKLGGQLLAFYYCFGEYDGVVIFEAPDEASATATIITAITPGHLKTTETTVLVTVEDTVEAMRKADPKRYRGPELWTTPS
jgi:uncharacterized protein with GYD domain